MEVPRELQWIGPLFAVLYFILWGRRGFAPFLVIFGHVWFLIIISLILVPILLLIVFVGINNRYRYAVLILCLSFFFSGILIEPIPNLIPYPELYPPPSAAPIPLIFIMSPFYAILSLVLSTHSTSWFIPGTLFAGFLLLISLAVLTAIVTGLASEGRIDAVQVMIFLVSLIVCWTFSYIPLYPYIGMHIFMTPIPLGPLVALNILPWVPVRKSELQENQVQ